MNGQPEAAAKVLVERAKANGGRDNITVVIVDVVAGGSDIANDYTTGIRRESGKLPFGYRWLDGRELRNWISDAQPFTDADAEPSPEPSGSKLWFS